MDAVNEILYIDSDQGNNKTVSVTIKAELSNGQSDTEVSFDVTFQDIEVGIFVAEENVEVQTL